MRFDIEKVRRNVRQAETEDLLDRATVFREQMEPEALEAIEAELRSRGVTWDEIDAHARQREGRIVMRDGLAARCSFCRAPAVCEARGWHRLLGVLPLFPRRFYYCEYHRPR